MISPWQRVGPFVWTNLNPQGCIGPSLVENYILWKRVGPFNWTNLNPLHPGMPCAKFGWNWPSGSGEDCLISSMYFRCFVIIYTWKRAGPFIWKKLEFPHLRMLCAKFGWNLPSGSGEEEENVKNLRTDGRQAIRKAKKKSIFWSCANW